MSDSMVERVARALCRAMNVDPDGHRDAHRFRAMQDVRHGDALVTLTNWEAAAHLARAAITAMRDPTRGMLSAPGRDERLWSCEPDEVISVTWGAMIDAALKEGGDNG